MITVILSEAKDPDMRGQEILRFAQDDICF
jgi:hypothetical protein